MERTLTTEVLRYLGIHDRADPQTLTQVSLHLEWLATHTPGATVSRLFDCTIQGDTLSLDNDSKIRSADLCAHLGDSRQTVLFAATLGVQADTRLRLLTATALSEAVIFDACASAYIEQVCDVACGEIGKKVPTLTHRFSPGYGDFDLQYQRLLCDLLQTHKRIGLTLTDTLTLTPAKSVTAVMGIRQTGETCGTRSCLDCGLHGCTFKKQEES